MLPDIYPDVFFFFHSSWSDQGNNLTSYLFDM